MDNEQLFEFLQNPNIREYIKNEYPDFDFEYLQQEALGMFKKLYTEKGAKYTASQFDTSVVKNSFNATLNKDYLRVFVFCGWFLK